MSLPDAPLHGQRVLVTRPAGQARSLVESLSRHGAEVVAFPTIAFAPPTDWSALDDALDRLADYHWVIFTSVNGVRFFCQRLDARGIAPSALAHARLAAIGPATAREIERLGLAVALVPDEYIAEAVADGLGDVFGQRILLPRAAEAREALAVILRDRGATVDEIATYYTLPAHPSAASVANLERGIDIATFTSSSTVRNYFALLGEDVARRTLAEALVACIGPITASTARDYGLTVGVVAEQYTADGLVAAILRARGAPVA
jgi:uroporphyrinogen III methyltransferase / synthase